MEISGKISDLRMLVALFGDVTIIEIIEFKELTNKSGSMAAKHKRKRNFLRSFQKPYNIFSSFKSLRKIL
jgi:hypothetical protein